METIGHLLLHDSEEVSCDIASANQQINKCSLQVADINALESDELYNCRSIAVVIMRLLVTLATLRNKDSSWNIGEPGTVLLQCVFLCFLITLGSRLIEYFLFECSTKALISRKP